MLYELRYDFCFPPLLQLLGKGSSLFRLSPTTGQVFLESSLATDEHANVDKFYLRIRATDRSGHITESQLVVHVLKDQLDNPPMMKGLAAIDAGRVEVLGKGMST